VADLRGACSEIAAADTARPSAALQAAVRARTGEDSPPATMEGGRGGSREVDEGVDANHDGSAAARQHLHGVDDVAGDREGLGVGP
jgi:hypothetical protein